MRTATVAVLIACLAGTALAEPASVGVDLSQLEGVSPADTTAIEQMLVARLVEEGFAVVPLASTPAIVLAITARDGDLVVAAHSARFERTREVAAHGELGAALRLELVQKAVELARLAAEAIPPPPARTDPERPASLPPPVAQAPAGSSRWTAGVDAGVLARGGGSDAELAVRVRAAIWREVGATLRASGSTSSSNGIDVRELTVLLGPCHAWRLSDPIAIELALLAGLRDQHFHSAMTIAEPTGSRFDPVIAAPLRLVVVPMPAIELSAWIAASVASARAHVLGSTVLWHRDAVGIGGGAGVAARF